MKRFAFFFPLLLAFFLFEPSEPHLFPIRVDDKIGYIDSSGKVIIPATYRAGGEFSEGLVAVRTDKGYGYINADNQMVIEDRFDYGHPFQQGLALVYINGQPFFIDKKGVKAFDFPFPETEDFKGDLAIVTTETGKRGCINRKGVLLVDTVYDHIDEFKDGVALVRTYDVEGERIKIDKVGVIDLSGNIIVPLGKYKELNPFSEGFSLYDLEEYDKDSNLISYQGLINTKGEELFRYGNDYGFYDKVSEGLIQVNIKPAKSKTHFQAYMNTQGKVVLQDRTIEWGGGFSEGRAFVKKFKDENYILIDERGQPVCDAKFDWMPERDFKNGRAVVSQNRKHGIINRDGLFLCKPQFEHLYPIEGSDLYAFIDKDDRYGIVNAEGTVLTPAQFEFIDYMGFKNGLISAFGDRVNSYINSQGKIVWKEEEPIVLTLGLLNIDYMNRGYFLAQSSMVENSKGWYKDENRPVKMKAHSPEKSLQLIIDTTVSPLFQNQYYGYTLTLINNGKDTVLFDGEDSRLPLRLQALNSKGEWKDIEYLPHSWCGNSYHKINLADGEGWKWTIPRYEGVFQTKLRAVVTRVAPNSRVDKFGAKLDYVKVISNEILGSVNPGQFWRKREYYPTNIMDPYRE